MTGEELKQKCKERAKIFQQAMESCHSSNPIDCIEWFADRIAELEQENERLTDELKTLRESIKDYGAGCYENGLRNGRRKLEAQIEKMKNCKNCNKLKKEKDGLLVCTVGSFNTNTFGENCDKWEIKEKK